MAGKIKEKLSSKIIMAEKGHLTRNKFKRTNLRTLGKKIMININVY